MALTAEFNWNGTSFQPGDGCCTGCHGDRVSHFILQPSATLKAAILRCRNIDRVTSSTPCAHRLPGKAVTALETPPSQTHLAFYVSAVCACCHFQAQLFRSFSQLLHLCVFVHAVNWTALPCGLLSPRVHTHVLGEHIRLATLQHLIQLFVGHVGSG